MESGPEHNTISWKGTKGCFVTRLQGCIAVLVALALACVVGVLVGVAHPGVCPSSERQAGVKNDTTTAHPKNIYLPDNLIPFHYDLHLHPDIYQEDPKDFTFTGNVNIYIDCKKATQIITLHARDLSIDEKTLTVERADDHHHFEWDHTGTDKAREFFKIHLKQALMVGERYVINITFNGPIKHDLRGIYYGSYQHNENTT